MVLDNIVVSSVFDIMTIPIECGTHRQICNRFSYGFSFASDAGVLRYDHNGESYTSDATHAVLLPMGQTYTLTGINAGEFPLINFCCDSSAASVMSLARLFFCHVGIWFSKSAAGVPFRCE